MTATLTKSPITQKGNLGRVMKGIAACHSLYPDTNNRVLRITFNLRGAYQCLQLLYISTYFPYWETDSLISSISEKAFRQNYNGRWQTVQDFLETELQTPKQFEEKYVLLRGPFDFFGPFLEGVSREIFLVKMTDMTVTYKGPVVYPIYRRGYKDKGTLRPLHKSFRNLPGEDIRVDRRNRITHPLLQNDSTAEECVLMEHPLRKEGEHDHKNQLEFQDQR